ncbi:MAG: type II secretion system protein [Chthoniobacteraceae bacterium]|nr:type II secretion system protein [Chthoniobacteraceae bacterium]
MNTRAAFTFVEILAALIFLAILLPAVFEGITYANRASVIAERQAVAVELAQNKLAELTLDNTWTSADPSGDFGPDWPGYRWESTQTTWDRDSMTVLAVQTYFPVQGREQSITLSTLVSSTASSLTTTSSSTSSSSTSGTARKTSR